MRRSTSCMPSQGVTPPWTRRHRCRWFPGWPAKYGPGAEGRAKGRSSPECRKPSSMTSASRRQTAGRRSINPSGGGDWIRPPKVRVNSPSRRCSARRGRCGSRSDIPRGNRDTPRRDRRGRGRNRARACPTAPRVRRQSPARLRRREKAVGETRWPGPNRVASRRDKRRRRRGRSAGAQWG